MTANYFRVDKPLAGPEPQRHRCHLENVNGWENFGSNVHIAKVSDPKDPNVFRNWHIVKTSSCAEPGIFTTAAPAVLLAIINKQRWRHP